MIPAIMLVINTGALSSVFLTLFCLTMSRPPLQHIPVMYLMGVAVAVIMIIQETRDQFSLVLNAVVAGTMYIHLALSLLINIYATSIIALKAWCVHVTKKHFINYALIDDTMHAYIQEIPQVADGKRYRYAFHADYSTSFRPTAGDNTVCPHCNAPWTMPHVLFDCDAFWEARGTILDPIYHNTIHHLFSSKNGGRRLVEFLHATQALLRPLPPRPTDPPWTETR
jgi:hypothetical protein